MKDWLSISSKAARQELKTWLAQQEIIDESVSADNLLEDLALIKNLPAYIATSTTAKAVKVSPTGAAILPKGLWGDDQIPRVAGWKKILNEIGRGNNREFIAAFLRDIEFQHHQSTNGRMNFDLGRWERYGVRSVSGWMRGGKHQLLDHAEEPAISRRTFHRVKDQLVELGLIAAEAHLWLGKVHLWIKPTQELTLILFKPGYWASVKSKYVLGFDIPKPKVIGKGKRRGISAIHHQLDAELRALYMSVIRHELPNLSKTQSWEVWDRLTKPIQIGKNYTRAAFAEKGSYRYKRIYAGLGLAYF